MMRNSQQQFHRPGDHPEELFEAYALGALDREDMSFLESHLEDCADCGVALAEMLDTSALLAEAVPQLVPPPELQSRVMEAVEQLPPVFVPAAAAPTAPFERAKPASRFSLSSFVLPLAALLVISLLTASLIMNVITTSRMNSLNQERMVTDARITQLEQEKVATANRLNHIEQEYVAYSTMVSQLDQNSANTGVALKQAMETSYLMANPYTKPLMLLPTSGDNECEGILLINDDGMEATLMLSNMTQTHPAHPYQVWLSRDGHQHLIGQVSVDSSGWASMPLRPTESLYEFDSINLTMEEPQVDGSSSDKMVLETMITSPETH